MFRLVHNQQIQEKPATGGYSRTCPVWASALSV